MPDSRHAGTPDNEGDVELVRSFANTFDADEGTDELASVDDFTAWLHERGLLAPTDVAAAADVALARELRTALRAEMASHHEATADPTARAALDRVAAVLPVRLAFSGDDRPALVPLGSGARAALGALLAAAHSLARDGVWERLKICPDDSCGWAFYDTSRNRSRRWCSMGTCGNRSKVRAFRTRAAAQLRL